MTPGVGSGRLMPMNQANGAYGSFRYAPPCRKIVIAMKLGLASPRLRNRATLRAGLALVFAFQIVGLCFCMPAAVDEHGCCPPTNEADFPSGPSVFNLSTQARPDCCHESPGMRAILRISEPETTTTQISHATVVPLWLVRSDVPARPPHTGSVPVRHDSSVRRSPILRI